MLPLLGRCLCHVEEGPVLLKDRERQEGSGSHREETGNQGGKGQESHRKS